MNKSTYCPMIHGGLNINIREQNETIAYNHCCLSTAPLEEVTVDFWNSKMLASLRDKNLNQWDEGCWECKQVESAGKPSFRVDMTNKFGIKTNLSGPQRIDLLFDRSCNLACRICGPSSSTFWQQHLKQNNIQFEKFSNTTKINDIILLLKSLDLSNLEMIQFCGGETLMGNTYWKTAKIISDLVPDAKDKLTLGFQTNGTQVIDEKNYEIIEKFQLVKILISLDGIGDRFDYMRWPANWNQVSENILQMKEKLPVNVMFLVQETLTNLNLFYHTEVSSWIKENFPTNRLGDETYHSAQLVIHEKLDVNHITQEYYNAVSSSNIVNLLKPNWAEDPQKIKLMLEEVTLYDNIRNQNWTKTFPEVADFYSRYLR